MEVDGDLSLSVIESNMSKDLESFGDISCITPDDDNKEINEHAIETDTSTQETSMSISGQESYNATDYIEISDVLGLVGKCWSMYHVTPLWNLHFNKEHLNLLCKQLNNILTKHITTKLKNCFPQISVEIEAKEAHHEYVAIKIEVFNIETNTQLYTGLLLKSPNYTENYSKNNLSDMPVLMVQGNKSIITEVHNWLTNNFDCLIRPYEFSFYQFLWLIALSMSDAGQFYNETVLYHYLYKYELSKGQMDVKCYVESEYLRLILVKLSLNQSSTEATFRYSDLINVQAEIEDYFKVSSGINVSKLKLKAFEAPRIASIKGSGKMHVHSSSLMDLILKYLMEHDNNKFMS